MSQEKDHHNSPTYTKETPSFALVALGANLVSRAGSPEKTLSSALTTMGKHGVTVESVSRFVRTPCFPLGAGPDYVNATARVSARLTPQQFLAVFHEIEDDFGRKREKRWGQRSLDIDLLAVDEMILPDQSLVENWLNLPLSQQMTATPDQLILPHPRIQDRAFVLLPLLDIAAGWRHPILGLTVQEMADNLPEADKTAIKPL